MFARFFLATAAAFAIIWNISGAASLAAESRESLVMIVMDPLAAPLSCPCVKGYAQRDYEKLGRYLAERLGRPVRVEFSESLPHALKAKSEGRADLVVGKHSVVAAEARESQLKLQPCASLTDKQGETTQKGLFVVAAGDPALSVTDLGAYRLFFGPANAAEKHGAAVELMASLELAIPQDRETCAACSEGATKILELHQQGERAATVISSYAKPLLEGCGTINKGDLRVIGETEPVPFVVAFVNQNLPSDERGALEQALLAVGRDKTLCEALETKRGFIPIADDSKKK